MIGSFCYRFKDADHAQAMIDTLDGEAVVNWGPLMRNTGTAEAPVFCSCVCSAVISLCIFTRSRPSARAANAVRPAATRRPTVDEIGVPSPT